MKTHLQNNMKKLFVLGMLAIMVIACPQQTHAQNNMGINTTSPDASAALDVRSGSGLNQGILIPFVNLATATFPSPGPANGLIVHNTNASYGKGIGLYRNSGTTALPVWKKMLETEDAWNTVGNSNTNVSSNFIGTTDNNDVAIRRNTSNVSTQFIQITGSGLGISATSPTDNTNSGKTLFFGQSGNITGTSGLDISIDQDNNSTSSKFRIIKDGTTNLLALAEVGTIGLGSSENVGTTGQVLTSAGTGAAATWAGPGKLSNIVSYTSGSGTYTVPAGVTAILVKLVGGGGAGGGAPYNSCTGKYFVGGGGGAGGYCESIITSPASSYSYSVGIGGLGTTACTTAGGSGGNTTFGSLTAGGGTGGSYNSQGTLSSTVITAAGGTGGTSSGGNLNLTGASGYQGYSCSGNYYVSSGDGGSTMFGNGGPGITWYYSVYTFIKAGLNASSNAFGAGGGGAFSTNSAGLVAGGNGTGGIIIIYEYK